MSSYREHRGARTGMTLWRVDAEAGDRRILPDGAMDIMWSDDRYLFAGADTTAMLTQSRQSSVTWGIRLPPGVAPALLGIPARDLTDRRLELGELVTVPTQAVDCAAVDPPAGLEQLVRSLWQLAAPDPGGLRLAASLDRAIRAGLHVPEVADRHGISERTLRRISDRVFGYGPKTLSAIHRFQRALQLARDGASLGVASATAGYVDQSHLNRDARRLAGTTPGELLGPVLEGPMLEGPVLEGPVLDGPMLEGPMLEGPVLDDAVEGGAGRLFQDDTARP